MEVLNMAQMLLLLRICKQNPHISASYVIPGPRHTIQKQDVVGLDFGMQVVLYRNKIKKY